MSTIPLSQLNEWNQKLQKNLNDIFPATNFQKSNYQSQTTHMMLSVYKYLFWIYISLSIILIGCIFMYTTASKYIKVLISILVIGFPFYIYKTEQYIYAGLSFIYSLFTSTIYSNIYLNHY